MITIDKPEFIKVFDCSTGHINEQDDSLLGLDRRNLGTPDPVLFQPLIVQELYGGARLISTWDGDDFAELNETMLRFGYTQELFNLLEYAHSQGCGYLKLDRDGPLYNDVPQFEW